MAFAAKYLSQEYVSKHIAILAKGLESVSTNLSVIALIGLALVPLVPDRVASTLAARAAPTPAPQAAGPSAPVEVVKAKPVFVPPTPLPLEAALRPPAPLSPPPAAPEPAGPDTSAEPEGHMATRVLTNVARERRRRSTAQRPRPESGDGGKGGARSEAGELGKAGTKSAAAAKTPVPPSNPKSDSAKAEPPEPDEWSDREIIAALRDCLKRLAPLGAEVEIAQPTKQEQCGNPAPVLLKRIGQGSNRVEFQPPPMLNCAMVAGLHAWVEKTLQPTAQEMLGTSIARVRGASGYACRNRNGTRLHNDRLSEHAHANAIDIMGFVTADGRTIDVLNRWGPTARDLREEQQRLAQARAEAQRVAKEAAGAARDAARQADKDAAEAARAAAKAPAAKRTEAKAEAARKKEAAQEKRKAAEEKEAEARRLEPVRSAELSKAEYSKLGRGVDAATPTTAAGAKLSAEATFLRRLHKGACSSFGTVLGPEANEAHRNHFHFDLAPRRRSNFCE
jgi:hypothetical protein